MPFERGGRIKQSLGGGVLGYSECNSLGSDLHRCVYLNLITTTSISPDSERRKLTRRERVEIWRKRQTGSSGFRVRDAVSDCRVLVMNEGRALGEDRSSSTRLSPKALSCNLPFLPRRVPSLMSFAALSSSASTSPALTSPMMTSLSSKPHHENLSGTAPSAVLKAGCVTT